MKILIVCPRWE